MFHNSNTTNRELIVDFLIEGDEASELAELTNKLNNHLGIVDSNHCNYRITKTMVLKAALEQLNKLDTHEACTNAINMDWKEVR